MLCFSLCGSFHDLIFLELFLLAGNGRVECNEGVLVSAMLCIVGFEVSQWTDTADAMHVSLMGQGSCPATQNSAFLLEYIMLQCFAYSLSQ